jgi:alkylation response protein AidB-like acyl-CoA dehydrogenase
MSVEYARQRVAFGRPIGSFQAIKHMCVDMFVATEQLRSLVWFAAWAADTNSDELATASSAVRAFAADSLELCSASTIQVHGGIGFTWEHDAHLYWRRGKVDRLLYGDAAEHRDAVAKLALQSVRKPEPALAGS